MKVWGRELVIRLCMVGNKVQGLDPVWLVPNPTPTTRYSKNPNNQWPQHNLRSEEESCARFRQKL